VPRTGEDFFNRLSSFLRDTLYVSAASDEQRCGHIRPTHKKSLQTLNGLRGLRYFRLGVTEQPTKAPFFIWWAVLPNLLMKKEPTSCEVSHKFIGSASMRLAL
jgi:hypothetical protein